MKDEIVLIMQKIFPGNSNTLQQPKNSFSLFDTKKKSTYSKTANDETNDVKILRLESELKLALEEYARVQKMLEENIQRSNSGKK